MTIYGDIRNDSGELLTGGKIFLLLPGGIQSEPFTITDGTYSAWTDENPALVQIVFSDFAGYADKTIQFAEAAQLDTITLNKRFQYWQIALVLAGVYLYQKKHSKVGKLSTGDVLPIMMIVGGILGFSLIKQILEWLGLWDSKDTKSLDDAATNPNSFWNPNYWMTIKPENANWTYAISEAEAKEWIDEIYNSIGPINDCEDCVKAIFRRCRTKANASFLAWVFQRNYGQDLLAWLRGGWWPQDRLSDADVNEITQYINQLPNY